jgi:hypothetical protein
MAQIISVCDYEDVDHKITNAIDNSVSPRIKLGLTDVYHKLSDYYYQYDASPFYT